MKYKVGDTVIIRADLKIGSRTMLGVFPEMARDAGRAVTIVYLSERAFKYEKDGYWFSFDMIQSKTNKLFTLL